MLDRRSGRFLDLAPEEGDGGLEVSMQALVGPGGARTDRQRAPEGHRRAVNLDVDAGRARSVRPGRSPVLGFVDDQGDRP